MPKPGIDVETSPGVTTPFGTVEYKNFILVVYILTLFGQLVDSTAMNVAIPELASQFGVAETEVDWIIVGYLLALAVTLPVSGWLADRFGSRRVFLAALFGFVASSLLCGVATTLEQLIAFRVLQGASAGAIMPVASAIMLSAFPMRERARASTIIIGVVVIAPAIGPVLGGALIKFLSWRWIFYVNLPIGGAALVLAALWMRDLPRKESKRFDLLGFVLAGFGLAAILFGLSEGPNRGYSDSLVLAALGAGIAAIVGLIGWQLRATSPLLKLSLYRERLFRSCNIVGFPAYMAFMSLIIIMPIYLQSLRGYSALAAGAILMPQPIGVFIMSQLVGRSLYPRIGPRRLMIIGLSGAFVVGLAVSRIGLDTPVTIVAVLMLLRGLCMGLLFVPIQTATYARIDIPDMPQATTLFSMQRQIAPAFGAALAFSWIAARSPASKATVESAAEHLPAFQEAMLVAAVPFLIAAVLAVIIRDSDAAETMQRRR